MISDLNVNNQQRSLHRIPPRSMFESRFRRKQCFESRLMVIEIKYNHRCRGGFPTPRPLPERLGAEYAPLHVVAFNSLRPSAEAAR